MRIYIRHAEKQYANGQSNIFKHDPSIVEESFEDIKKVVINLIKTYGYPKVIYTSPYRRTRETAWNMWNILPYKPKIFVDSNLSEYLGNQDHIDVTPETEIYSPPPPETFYNFKERVKHHNFRAKYIDYGDDVVWFVTHGIVIKSLPKCKYIKYLKPLDYVVIDKENVNKGSKDIPLHYQSKITTVY